MTTKQEDARIAAILEIGEHHVKVLWDVVVERGAGLNWKVHGRHTAWQGPMETIAALPAR